jgi:hypothetical protein
MIVRENMIWASMKNAKNPSLDLVRIESWNMLGIPDINGCFRGTEFWIESKVLHGPKNKVVFRPFQVPWLLRRRHAGGRAYVFGINEDKTIKVYDGIDAIALEEGADPIPLFMFNYPWNWELVFVSIATVALPVYRG